MQKSGNKLRVQNLKNKKELPSEDKIEVSRDPLDGNVYLHIDPAELARMSPEELQ